MTSREMVLSAMAGEQVERPVWVPFVGCHGGKLLGVTAEQYLTDEDLLVGGLEAAHRRYRPDGLPVAFDLQIEAEMLGCPLHWAEEAPPAVVGHPMAGQPIEAFPAYDTATGRLPMALSALRRIREGWGKDLALYGLITGPFTLAMHLRGPELFLEMFDDPDGVKALMDRCAEVACRTAEAYVEAGADVVAVVDPMTSQISPDAFADFVAPYLNRVFNHIRSLGGLSSLFVCGDASRNLEGMCETACDNVSIDENISLDLLRELARPQEKSFGGNLKLTTVLLLGSEQDSRVDAVRCIDAGGERGFILAPGCDLPFHTPPENLEAVAAMVHDPYQQEVVRTADAVVHTESFDDVHLPDYAREDSVWIDVITLDSSACAPCQYMVKAVSQASEVAEVPVVVREHKITTREGLGVMQKLGVSNLPTICIDGEVGFVSLIPDQPTLLQAIRESAEAKAEAGS